MQYFAKSKPMQTIQEHTTACLAHLYEFKKLYPRALNERDWEILEYVVFFHDFGKLNIKFQNKLRKDLRKELLKDLHEQERELGHNFLSCAYIDREKIKNKFSEDEIEIIYKSIYYHHHRREVHTDDVTNYIKNILSKERVEFEFKNWQMPSRLNQKYVRHVAFVSQKGFSEAMQNKYFLIKGLLNKLDYTASSGTGVIEELSCYADGSGLVSRVQETIVPNEMQQCMQQHKDENLLVIASTGLGKTEGAFLWIEDHKAFYTLPIKVASNAIYKRIKDRYSYDKVSILHSDAFKIYSEQIDGDIKYEQSKLLAKPLTVCTIDQLFKFVYKYNGGEMPLATLSYSKLVIDEVQMYTPDLLATTIVALKRINDLGGKFCIITATMPKLLVELMAREKIYFPELKVFHSIIDKRHRIKILSDKEFDYDVIKELGDRKRILVIANTVRRAQAMYTNLRNLDGNVELLHSSYIKKDRGLLEKRICDFAPNDKERDCKVGIWVTTQIVEASLDIDFDILFTEMCSIDSLLQRMGRVYRNRFYNEVLPNIFILDNKNTGRGKVIDNEIYEYSMRAVKCFDGQLLDESDECDKKQAMMDMVYSKEQNSEILGSKYYEKVVKKVNLLKNLLVYDYEQQDVKLIFRDIESKKIIPLAVYKELLKNGQIDKWKKELSSSDKKIRYITKSDIDDYTISISHFQYLNLDLTKEVISGSKVYLADLEYYFSGKDNINNLGLIKAAKNKTETISVNPFM